MTAAPAPDVSTRRIAAALTALVIGGVGIGTTEFVTMGLLPEIAEGIDVSIPQAGHTISAYALGVVIGAPVIAVLGSRIPRRGLLIALMVLFVVGNAASALAGSYGLLFVARLLAGLPHGAFFGVASIVAYDLAAPGRGGTAVSRVMLGIPIANVAGVPIATWLGQTWGWRAAYWSVAVVGVVTVLALLVAVPRIPSDDSAGARAELGALGNLQFWLTLLVGAVGFGGMFSMFSYISPTLQNETGVSASVVPVYLAIFGLGALAGTLVAGRLVDISVLRSLVGSALAMIAGLVLFTLVAGSPVLIGIALFLTCSTTSVFVVALQLRLMSVAGQARSLGAAGNHASLNLANAFGAWLGGVVLDLGWGWRAPAAVGAGLALAGLVVLGVSVAVHRRAG
ncbi:MFS transporter [Marihabitans asiaticum]|uniref:DHA1 family inner membrane transport protein n=1 Tax=Marihabitans asiaticum TaxID=415218 RepID=A0A560WEA1_9MICO|nr:MFS transporter [Marihabitans asiaticum]TWD15999.1 DHA1 family inner membrane transport protein [Marihabitans asiaticum]